ncbi:MULTISPECIES: hypothetical protein [Bradyrhizobium]|jgi:hypothetical protein|uniref:Uncharacterized protein n=1 Tax=Bradyrhizobium elkanii TaxID=29448 RepID=A0ABV4F2C2_BRAEL|nr:hypothetical protein [Bradyrhizobium elkanii]MCP1932182.1 hypothetical protein [Bradyrhizobium elkanii]MCS3577278.1 hypothetical protein [Bradyrhizobium elkanii]MCS3720155.1 hypothetical protein [Bradyrhizobium elkanii]MCS3881088.1 hypothetical protein [Bradyrhizobium elkanii]MCS4004572.1 hypothetical protein [Bradyrhizobium elkanii USDA 61]
MAREYVSPSGSAIIGTLERLTGRCGISGIEDDGTPVHDSDGTVIFYDDQVTATKDGKTVFLDDNGAEWTFDQLTPVDDEEDEDDDDA